MAPSRRFLAALLLGTALTAAACGGSDGDRDDAAVEPGGPLPGLADDAPDELAFRMVTEAPSTVTLGDDAGIVAVHSGPDRLYTRIGDLRAGDAVGFTGTRVDEGGVAWLEIIWNDSTAWVDADRVSVG